MRGKTTVEDWQDAAKYVAGQAQYYGERYLYDRLSDAYKNAGIDADKDGVGEWAVRTYAQGWDDDNLNVEIAKLVAEDVKNAKER